MSKSNYCKSWTEQSYLRAWKVWNHTLSCSWYGRFFPPNHCWRNHLGRPNPYTRFSCQRILNLRKEIVTKRVDKKNNGIKIFHVVLGHWPIIRNRPAGLAWLLKWKGSVLSNWESCFSRKWLYWSRMIGLMMRSWTFAFNLRPDWFYTSLFWQRTFSAYRFCFPNIRRSCEDTQESIFFQKLGILMLARSLFNEHDKGSNMLSTPK